MTGATHPREYVVARKVLLDALEALEPHLGALVLVGAQAVYLHAPQGIAQPPFTTDGDLAIDPDFLAASPEIAATMELAGFVQGINPGAWMSHEGVEIDLMVPAGSQPGRTSRTAMLTGHHKSTARRAPGLEVALHDHSLMLLGSLELADTRTAEVRVAGPAALTVAKLVKIRERLAEGKPGRVDAKDAGDLLRLLRSCDAPKMGERLAVLGHHEDLGVVIDPALAWLETQLAAPRSRLVTLTLDALAGTEPENQVVDSLRTLGRRLLSAYAGTR
jgi:hypothetical protein